MSFEKIAIFGLGYIGLPTAAMFASCGCEVLGIDIHQSVVDTINRGEIHIVEPDLDAVVKAAVSAGKLSASLEPHPADAFIIAVPTPFKEGQAGHPYEPDLSYIEAAAKTLAPVLRPGNLVVLESTSPIGATEKMEAWLAEARPDLSFPSANSEASDIRIAHCPERVLPGNVMNELVSNDRVIGGITPSCSKAAVELYKNFVAAECVTTTSRTAEMCKLAENSFRDVNIAYANELSIICDKFDIDVWELIQLANRHPRVDILQPGPGVGGHCIAVDPWFIVSSAPRDARLIRNARETNNLKPEWVLNRIKQRIAEEISKSAGEKAENDITVACFGLAFKPDIDDFRESPSLAIVEKLETDFEGKLLVVEPNAETLPSSLSKAQLISGDASDADIRVFLVKHSPFMLFSPDDGKDLDFCGLFANKS